MALASLAAGAADAPIHFTDLGLKRYLFQVGSFELRWYSLAYLAGIVLGYWHLTRMARAPGAPLAQRHCDDLFFYCTLGIIFGGRLGYALFYTGGGSGVPSMLTHVTPGQTIGWDLLRLWDGGMSFHGGLIGTVMAIAWVSWRGQLNFLRVCDYLAVCVPFGLFFGRLANFVNGELFGRITTARWGVIFPGGGPQPRHPSQIYEALLEGVALYLVMLLLSRSEHLRARPGFLAGTFLIGYAAFRTVAELFREPDTHLGFIVGGVTMGQILCLPMLLVGVILVLRASHRT